MKLRGSSLLKFQEREAKTALYNKDFVSTNRSMILMVFMVLINGTIGISLKL